MYENVPPTYVQAPPRASGLGCFAKGCLTVIVVLMLVGVMIGGIGWYVARNFMPFFGQEPAAIRVFPATDEQYHAVREKIAPFASTVNNGGAATLNLTADDINILIARDPQYADLRGKAYLTIADNTLSTDASFPLNDVATNKSQKVHFNGRIVFDASFASGDFTLVLRRLEPLGGGPTPGLVTWLVDQQNVSSNISRGLNEGFRKEINKNPAEAAFLNRLRTVIVKDNQIVITALEASGAVAAPPNPP